uniref:Tectonic-1-3 N-terminal domain-containing protein n=1 Tax=Monopterus albus TaxID=43700 RepID=A0A3Q3REE6_MONAL
MAASDVVIWSFSNIFCLFLSFSAVTADENITIPALNTTVFGDHNVTYNDSYTTTQPDTTPAFESTTPTPSYKNTEEPLPVSGRLLTPVTNVDRLCPCDEHSGVCDINCCCDKECSGEVALFTDCSVRTVRSQLCSSDVASYTLSSTASGYSELQSSVQKEMSYDVFCIQSQNRKL